jgi:putative transposase
LAKQANTPSFIDELPLLVNKSRQKALLTGMETAWQLYNASANLLNDLTSCMASSNFKRPGLPAYANNEKRSKAFKAVKGISFSAFSLQKFIIKAKNACNHTVQKNATRAFDTAQKYAFRKRGRPRFKGKRQLVGCSQMRFWP